MRQMLRQRGQHIGHIDGVLRQAHALLGVADIPIRERFEIAFDVDHHQLDILPGHTAELFAVGFAGQIIGADDGMVGDGLGRFRGEVLGFKLMPFLF